MTAPLTTEHLYEIAQPEQPAIAPDGRRVAYVLRTADRGEDRNLRSLWTVDADGDARRRTNGPDDTSPAWSPDGRHIAFLRAVDGPAQVWLLPADGGEPSKLTDLPFGAGAPVWSPDGTRLAFSAPVANNGVPDPVAPVVADRLAYKVDGVGPILSLRRHLQVVDVASGNIRQVTGGDWHATPPAWSPDGTRLAFSAAMDPDSDLTLRAGTYTVGVDGGRPLLAGLEHGLAGTPAWTTDGSALVVAGREDVAVGHLRLLKIPLDGGGIVDLAASLDRNVMPGGAGYPGAVPVPTADGRRVLFCARDQGYTRLYETDLDDGEVRCLVAAGVVSGLSVVGDVAAVVHSTETSYGEIATLDLHSGTLSTHTTHGTLQDVELLVPVERTFTLTDGSTVHGWLLADPAADGPRPLLLDIHGGPHNAWNGAADPVHLYHQVLARRGWSVLLLNPRGSDGYGESFYRGAVSAWGQADEADFLEPVADLVAEGVADPGRLAITGYSYGGFMTCQLTSRTGMFAAAVAGGVVTDFTSMVGTSDMGWYTGALELAAAPWEEPERYRELSPITRVDRVRTPTLILQGGADLRCPVGQAEQWFTGLRARKVPSRLVLYPGASHLFILNGRPSHRLDWNDRIVDWVVQHTEAAEPVDLDVSAAGFVAAAERHGVPGAVLGVLAIGADARPDRTRILTHGVMNTRTGAPVSDDTLFQLGSITKVWTATLIMQLVDEGRLGLDTPITELLPDLQLGDPDVAPSVSLRQLLNHTSGIDGDVFTDTGRGDDALERYVAGLGPVSQIHPPGAMFSYCNAGYVIAGRIIEAVTGQTWDEALRSRLLEPLGLTRTVTLPEDAIVQRVAGGHVPGPDGAPVPAGRWSPSRSLGPAGAVTATVSDLLTFVRMHLAQGLGPNGSRVLSEQSAAAMTGHEVDVPFSDGGADSWGLGWTRYAWGRTRALGHDGATVGQSAYLRLLPDQGLAVALLTNGGDAAGLWSEVLAAVLEKVEAVELPAPVLPVEKATADIGDVAGSYGSSGIRVEVEQSGSGVVLRETVTGPLADLLPPRQSLEALPVRAGVYAYRKPGASTWHPVAFFRATDGTRYMHAQGRAKPELGEP